MLDRLSLLIIERTHWIRYKFPLKKVILGKKCILANASEEKFNFG